MRHLVVAALFLFVVSVAYLAVAAFKARRARARRPAAMADVVRNASDAIGQVYARKAQSKREVEEADRFIVFGKSDA